MITMYTAYADHEQRVAESLRRYNRRAPRLHTSTTRRWLGLSIPVLRYGA